MCQALCQVLRILKKVTMCIQERVLWGVWWLNAKDKNTPGAQGGPDPKVRGVPGGRNAWNVLLLVFFLRITVIALAVMAQWIECWPVNQRVPDLIPSQDTCLGCGPGPQ